MAKNNNGIILLIFFLKELCLQIKLKSLFKNFQKISRLKFLLHFSKLTKNKQYVSLGHHGRSTK